MEALEVEMKAEADEVDEIVARLLKKDDEITPTTAPRSRSNRLTLYVKQLLDVCGWRFLLFLFFSQCLCKGMLMTIMGNVLLPLFKPNTSVVLLQVYTMIVMIPWSAKPLIGLCSDYILIGGYHKRGWLIISLAIGISAVVVLCIWPAATIVTIVCICCIQFQLAMYDLLSEAKYSELRRNNPEIGSNITVFVSGLHQIGALAALTFVGQLSDAASFRTLFMISAALVISPTLGTLLGWLPEIRDEEHKRGIQLVDRERLRDELPIICIVAFCGLSGIASSATVTLADSPIAGLVVAVILLVCCLAGSWIYLPPIVTQIAIYQVVTSVAQPSVGTALDYFYTAPVECVLDGPHFTYSYYISYAGLAGRLISLVGVIVYQFFLSKLKFRVVLLVPTILQSIAGLSDLIIILRLNVAVGVPDSVSYILGQAIIEPFIESIGYLPIGALISMAAPKGQEASSFAFLAGISNFSRMVSKLSGAVIVGASGIGVDCDFASLWWMVLLCHISFPVAVGVPAVWLIPNIEQDAKL